MDHTRTEGLNRLIHTVEYLVRVDQKCLVRRMLIENVYLVDSPGCRNDEAVSYTHLDVYKRQGSFTSEEMANKGREFRHASI